MNKLKLHGLGWLLFLLVPGLVIGQNSYHSSAARITSFSGSSKNWNLVLLVWVTEAEVVQKKFEIQRSQDGINFAAIGTVLSNDNQADSKTYYYQDQELETLEADRLLYRIRQINSDGSSGYTKVLVINRSTSNFRMSVSVSPNPVVEELKIGLKHAASAPIGFRLVNVEGRELFRQMCRSTTNEYSMPAYAAGLRTAGIYFAQVFFEDGTSASIKFIKK